MSRTKIRQVIQIANSETYDDAYGSAHVAGGAEPAHPELNIEHDLNVIRTNMKELKGTGSWYSLTDGYDLVTIDGDIDDLEAGLGSSTGLAGITYTNDYNVADNEPVTTSIDKLDTELGPIAGGFTGSNFLDADDSDAYTMIKKLDEVLAGTDFQVTMQDAFDNSQTASETLPEIDFGANNLEFSGTGGMDLSADAYMTMTTAGTMDMDAADVDMDASASIAIDAGSTLSLDATTSANLNAAGGNLTLGSSATMDMDAATVDIDTTGNTIIDAGGGASIDAATTSNFSVSGGDLDLSASAELDLDGGTVVMDSAGTMSLDAAGATNLSTTTGGMTVAATAGGVLVDSDGAGDKIHLDSEGTGTDGVDIDSAGGIDLDAASQITLDSATSTTITTTTTFDVDATGAATIDSDALTTLGGASIDMTADATAAIGSEDGYITFNDGWTGGQDFHLSTRDLAWDAYITAEDGRASADIGIVDAINAAARIGGEQSLQSVYDETAGADPDILIQNGDELNFKLGDATSSFKVTSDGNDQILEVTDGYVKVDGYFVVQGTSFLVDSEVIDQDHLVLHPALGSEVALKLEPKVSQAAYTANLMEVWDGYETIDGALVMRLDDAGDAYFARSMDVDGTSDFEGAMNLQDTFTVAGKSTLNGDLQYDHTSAVDGYVLTSTDADGNAVWEPAGAVLGGDGLDFNGTTAELDVKIVPGETIIDSDRVGIDEAFSKTDFTSFTAISSGNVGFTATGAGKISLNGNSNVELFSDSGDIILKDGDATYLGTVADAYVWTAKTSGTGEGKWFPASSLTASTTLQQAYDNDTAAGPDIDFDAGGDFEITGDGGIVYTSTASSVLITAFTEADVTGATLDLNATGGNATLDSSADVLITATTEADVTGATLDLNATGGNATLDSSADVLITATTEADVTGATLDLNATGGAATMDASTSIDILAANGASSFQTTSGDLTLASGDGYLAFDQQFTGDAYYLSTGATGWNDAIEAIDGRSGNNIGIIDAINAAANAGSKSERAVYLITGDQTTIDLDTAADRGGVELGTSVASDFRPGRDLEIYVNGVLQLQDDYDNATHGGSVPTSPAAAPEDDFFYANEATNGTLKFAFTLKSGDVVTVINRASQAGEDTGTGWVAQ